MKQYDDNRQIDDLNTRPGTDSSLLLLAAAAAASGLGTNRDTPLR